MKRASESTRPAKVQRTDVQEQPDCNLRAEQAIALVLPYTPSTALLVLNKNLRQTQIQQGLPLQLAWSCVSTNNLAFCVDWHLERRLVCRIAVHNRDLVLMQHARAQGYPWGNLCAGVGQADQRQPVWPLLLWALDQGWKPLEHQVHKCWANDDDSDDNHDDSNLERLVDSASGKRSDSRRTIRRAKKRIAALCGRSRNNARLPARARAFVEAAVKGHLAVLQETTPASREPILTALEQLDWENTFYWCTELDAATMAWFLCQPDLADLLRRHLTNAPPYRLRSVLLESRRRRAAARVLIEAEFFLHEDHSFFPLAWIDGRFDRLYDCIWNRWMRLHSRDVEAFARRGWLALLRALLAFLDDCISKRDYAWSWDWFDCERSAWRNSSRMGRLYDTRETWLAIVAKAATLRGDAEMLRWATENAEDASASAGD